MEPRQDSCYCNVICSDKLTDLKRVTAQVDIAPRELTWYILIEQTGVLGLHFQDHEDMQGCRLPGWSHMTAREAVRFTEAFYGLVQRELAALEANGGNS